MKINENTNKNTDENTIKNQENRSVFLKEKAKSLPNVPGCYLFKDANGNVIYVGKAKCLPNRVRNYFTKAALSDPRTERLIPKISEIDYRITASELDALLLEYTLIKQYRPLFNRQMKRDRRYPYLRISVQDEYPAFSVCDEASDDGAVYYDFFFKEENIIDTVRLLCRIWGTPICLSSSFQKSRSTCMYHVIDHCMGVCEKSIDSAAYRETVDEICGFFNTGKTDKIKEYLTRMKNSAAALDFEKAAEYKEIVDGLKYIKTACRKRFHLPSKGKVLVLIRPYGEKNFSAFVADNGSITSRVEIRHERTSHPTSEELNRMYTVIENEIRNRKDFLVSYFNARALTAVSAQKLFVLLPDRGGTKRLIVSGLKSFLGNQSN